MARTARTADKAPGWGGGSSNGEGEGRWAGHHGSAAAAAASASSAADPRFTHNSRIRSDADYRRGSGTAARMHRPDRGGDAPSSAAMAMDRHRRREDRGRPPSYGNNYAYAHDRFARGRDGGDPGDGGDGRHRSASRYNENWGRDDRRGGGYGDGPPDTRRYDDGPRGYERRGRERGWEGNKRNGSTRNDERRETRDRDSRHHGHQLHGDNPHFYNDRRHQWRGDDYSERNGFLNERPPHKRHKQGRNRGEEGEERGQNHARRQEQPNNNDEVRALKENVARLQRQMGDLVSALHPKNNNAVAQSIAAGSGQNADAASSNGPTANGTEANARPADSEHPIPSSSQSTGTNQTISNGSANANAGMVTIASQRQANPKKETSNEDDPCFDASTDEDANFTNNYQFDDDEDASGSDANGSAEDANMKATEGEISAPPEACVNADGQINEEEQSDAPGEVSTSPRDSTEDETDAVGEQGGKNEDDSNTDRQITGGDTKNQVLFSKAIGDDSDSGSEGAESEDDNAQNVSLGNATSSQPAYKTTGEDSDNDGNSDDDEDSVDPVLRDYYDPEGELAFCCQNCSCWETAEKRFIKVEHIRNNCGNSSSGSDYGNTKLYHRACCHNDTETSDDYLSPMARARDDGQMVAAKALSSPAEGNSGSPLRGRVVDHGAVKRSYNTAKREEAMFENEEYDAANDSVIYSNPAYRDSCAKFGQRRKGRRSGLRVLDLFSGIGSGTVVLKRLKLPIHTIVHVEHDAVAVSVCKHNHKDDEINHTYVEAFQEIYGTGDDPDEAKVASLVEKHGPFDLVLAGAPCQNYSGLNSHRDVNSNNAQYLPKVGLLIQKLNDIQSSTGATEDVMFVSENVVFKHHEEVDKCYSDQTGGLTPLRMDARDFGPVKRNRFYWINMPVESTDAIKQVASAVSVDGLLDDGFEATARLLQSEEEKLAPVKANTFLASLKRIDDSRMYKCKPSTESNARRKYQIETYSVAEREKMMGLPPGYVEKPLKRLFSQLAVNAFYIPETSEGVTFRTFLPRDLWRLRKTTKFRFHPDPSDPFFRLSLSSPQEGKSQPSFFTEEQYAKHLIGNGWSVPVVEHLLGKLRDLFAEDAMETYEGYDYRHPWEPYLSI